MPSFPHAYLLTTFIFLVALSGASALCLSQAAALSRALLVAFAFSQASLSLAARATLRHTLSLTSSLFPALLFSLAWQTVSLVALGLCLAGLEATQPAAAEFALLQHYAALLVCYPPMLVFAAAALHRLRHHSAAAASVVLTTNITRTNVPRSARVAPLSPASLPPPRTETEQRFDELRSQWGVRA